MKLITSLYSTVTSYVSTLNRDTNGASAIEYGVIAGILAAILLIAITALGDGLDGMFQGLIEALPGEGGFGTDRPSAT